MVSSLPWQRSPGLDALVTSMTNVLSTTVNGFECNTYHFTALALCGILFFQIVQSVLCLPVQTWSCESAMPPQRTQSDLGNVDKLKQNLDPETNFERRTVGRRDVERF